VNINNNFLNIKNSFCRFVIVGLLNSIFGFVVFTIFALTSLSTWKVLLISNLIGILFNFFTIGNFVFNEAKISQVPKFLISYLAIYLTYLGLITYLEPIFGNRIIAMGIIVVPIAILTYLIQRFFVYKYKSKKG